VFPLKFIRIQFLPGIKPAQSAIKKMSEKPFAIKGMNDILPPDAARWGV
jgi:hypothetical protein